MISLDSNFMKKDVSGKELADIITKAKPRHPLGKWIIGMSLLALAGTCYWYYQRDADKEIGPIYNTQDLARGDLSLIITATGNLAPTNQVTVGSELSGTVSEVYVDANDTVKKGQPIAQLDTAKLTQQTERARATLLAARARVGQTHATLLENTAALARFQELQRLSAGKTPSKAVMEAATAAVERAKADLESANASVAQAEADLRSIERDLSKAIIRSPVDGIVLTRSIEVGQTVAASFTAPVLFLIAEDLRKMDLVVTVAEADIGRLANDQTASFTVDAWPTRTYTATVKRVSFGSVITNNVVTYNTELAVTNDDLSLRPGMTATADIAVAKSTDVLLVPNAALRFNPETVAQLDKTAEPKRTLVQSLSPGGGRRWWQGAPVPQTAPRTQGPSVWILKDGKPVEIPVQTGLTDGRFTEATGADLLPGIPIIISAKPAPSP
jgi:HlyD family secretion protein